MVIFANTLHPDSMLLVLGNCSELENAELFYASLTTLGQFGIILEATIKLNPAPKTCQCNSLYYDNLQSFMEDQTYLARNKSCQNLEGQIIKSGINPLKALMFGFRRYFCLRFFRFRYRENTLFTFVWCLFSSCFHILSHFV
jgi:hypothetical protein